MSPSSNHPSSASSGSHITLNLQNCCVSGGRQDTGFSIMNGITGVMLPLSPLLMCSNEARSTERSIMLPPPQTSLTGLQPQLPLWHLFTHLTESTLISLAISVRHQAGLFCSLPVTYTKDFSLNTTIRCKNFAGG